MKSQSVSALCWKKSKTTGVLVARAVRPASWATFETMLEADICWKVRTLRTRWSL